MTTNPLGILYALLGVLCFFTAGMLAAALKATEDVAVLLALIAAGLVSAVLDLRQRKVPDPLTGALRFFHPQRGGNLAYIPVWLIGAGFIVAGIASYASADTSSVAPESATTIRPAPSDDTPLLQREEPPPPPSSPFEVAELLARQKGLAIGAWKPVNDLGFGDTFYVAVVATWCHHSGDVLAKLDELTAAGEPWDLYELKWHQLEGRLEELIESGEVTRSAINDYRADLRRKLSGRLLNAVLVYETETDDLIAKLRTGGMEEEAQILQTRANQSFVYDPDLVRNSSYQFHVARKQDFRGVVDGFPAFLCCRNGSCTDITEADCP